MARYVLSLRQRTMVVEDERGNPWHVGAGDPARSYVLKLQGRGFTYIVLPSALLTGDAKGGIIEAGHVATSQPRSLPPANVDPTQIVRRARLIDCMEVLNV